MTAGAGAIGYFMGPYVGKVLGAIYSASTAFARACNRAVAIVMAKILHGSLEPASGSGWVIKFGKFIVRIMHTGGQAVYGRTNYIRFGIVNKGCFDLAGNFGNAASTHISINITNIIKIIQILLSKR